MSIKKVLKKEGIEIVKSLDTLTINNLAKNIANKLSNNFPTLNLNANDLFIKISRLNMYFAKLPSRYFCEVFL